MVSMTNQLLYQLEVVNKQNLEVNYQMSTGNEIQQGSDDSALYAEILNIEYEIDAYKGIETQLNQETIFNSNSDSSTAGIKTQMEIINSEVIKALNGGMDASSKASISQNIKGMQETIFNLANESSNDEYIFAGSATGEQPFVKAADGSVDYVGSLDNKQIMVDKNTYKDQGITGMDLLFYSSDVAPMGDDLVFGEDERIIDQEGNEWKFIDHDGDGNIDNDKLFINGDATGTSMNVTNNAATPIEYTVINTQATTLEAKTNYFDVLDEITNALEMKDKDGNTISEDDANAILSASLEKIEKAYDSTNTSHSNLGSKNKAFDNYSTTISAKITNYQVFYEETASTDLTEAAIKAQSLETTYSALYSTINRVNSLSLANYI